MRRLSPRPLVSLCLALATAAGAAGAVGCSDEPTDIDYLGTVDLDAGAEQRFTRPDSGAPGWTTDASAPSADAGAD
jgi:hypothetical protein